MKKILGIALAFVIIVSNSPTFAQKQINIIVDNQSIEFDEQPFIESRRILTPLRKTYEIFDVDVEYDNSTKTITCEKDDKIIKFTVGEKIANINGINVAIDVPARSINNRVFVPIRFVVESLGLTAEWNNASSTVNISKNKNENQELSTTSQNIKTEKYIAHAGGRINELPITNSKEALNNSYRNGYRLIEIDMNWTTDNNLALVHDWGNFAKFIGSNETKMYSSEEFKSFKISNNLTPMTIDDLASWLDENQGVYIVTDIKSRNTDALNLIKTRYPQLINRFIPQIYHFNEYNAVRNMGYENIIFTMYMSNYTDEEIVSFCRNHKLFAITMPEYTAKRGLASKLSQENIFTYAHTINKKEVEEELSLYGVKGFYTDDLLP